MTGSSRLTCLISHAASSLRWASNEQAFGACSYQLGKFLVPVRGNRTSATSEGIDVSDLGGRSSGSSETNFIGASSDDSCYREYDQDDGPEDRDDHQHKCDRTLGRVLRSSNAAELAAVHFFQGYSQSLRGRVDAQFFAAQEAEAADSVRQLLPRYRVRPSLAQGPLSLACFALGAAAAVAPPRLGLAVIGAVGDALSEHYNEQLRQINEGGAAREAADVRQAMRSLRDVPRIPEGAPPTPDLVSVLQQGLTSSGNGSGPSASSIMSAVGGAVQEWGPEGTAGALVKAGARVALEVAARL
ncbi:hypothetical protein Vretimale_1685 [Volvox reticuliferus]|uniref:Ubiquinone biosynthesis protein n=1 Tax=Volvox reticuliferus TaxID=1737510 RepID=A0A8J4CS46_9CHLO|nr:hypothetical protein Vretifemale_15519 [Volvox reticuliferus]GIL95719.1 hypothetical protein Vretimale_1685 [Volvox reticuliferus]